MTPQNCQQLRLPQICTALSAARMGATIPWGLRLQGWTPEHVCVHVLYLWVHSVCLYLYFPPSLVSEACLRKFQGHCSKILQ